MQLIGKGSRSSVYLKNRTTVLVKTHCKAKLAMSEQFWPKSNLFPKVKQLADGMYEMPKYHVSRALKKNIKPEHYKLYRELRSVYLDLSTRWLNDLDYHGQLVQNLLVAVSNKRYCDTIINAYETCLMYDESARMECSPRNVGYTDSGNLKLFDIFFFKCDH